VKDILEQIRAASDQGLYYVALFSALAIPDICGALESADGQASGAKYVAWFDRHVAPRYQGFLSGQDAYYFRCSMLHQGTTHHPHSSFTRILFVEPGATTNVFHNNIMGDALNIDVGIFVRDLVEAGQTWLTSAEKTPEYQAKSVQFVTRYPKGLPPYIVGVPVIG
jgi:hypothetical protein